MMHGIRLENRVPIKVAATLAASLSYFCSPNAFKSVSTPILPTIHSRTTTPFFSASG